MQQFCIYPIHNLPTRPDEPTHPVVFNASSISGKRGMALAVSHDTPRQNIPLQQLTAAAAARSFRSNGKEMKLLQKMRGAGEGSLDWMLDQWRYFRIKRLRPP
eukprot:g10559.t1